MDSRIVEMEYKTEKLSHEAKRTSPIGAPSIKIKWTLGELSRSFRHGGPQLVFLGFKDGFKENDYFDQLERYYQVEIAVRDFLSESFAAWCMKDCGDIGSCATHCTQFPGYDPAFGNPFAVDRYRPKGTLRDATREEIEAIVALAYMEIFHTGGQIGVKVLHALIDRNLTAPNDDIAEAIHREAAKRA